MNCLRLQPEVSSRRFGFSQTRLKPFDFPFFIWLKAGLEKADLRLKPEAIHRSLAIKSSNVSRFLISSADPSCLIKTTAGKNLPLY